MKLVFITEARYVKLNNGEFYSLESSFAMPLYERYLIHFDEILILARLKSGSVDKVIKSNLISDKRVQIIGLPYYIGFSQFIFKYFSLKKAISVNLKEIITNDSIVICRIPGRIGATSIAVLRKLNVPFGAEVVGDPFDLFAKGVIKHPLRIPLRYMATYSLKRLVKEASATLYVTKETLQKRYPSLNFNLGVSDVVIPQDYFADEAKMIQSGKGIKLISVGSLDQMYKSPDVVLKALEILKKKDIKYTLNWVGDGKYLNRMKQMAIELGLENEVQFLGKFPAGESVRVELCNSDIFLLISRTEGLPRALVEAMACGLPCIGTPVGGIPELIDKECLVEVDDPAGLAEKIYYLTNNPQEANRHANINLNASYDYEESKLEMKRKLFYDFLKQNVGKSNG